MSRVYVVEYLPHEIGLPVFKIRAPGVVSRAGHGVRRAGDFPAAEVLGADGEGEGGRGGGRELVQVGRAFLGVVEFVGEGGGADDFGVGVEGVGGVDGGEGAVEGGGHFLFVLFEFVICV